MEDTVDMKAWKKKRSNTLLAYMTVHFLIGVETGANTATLWIYLTKMINTNQPHLYYGLINIAVYILPLMFSSVVAKHADRTRRIKVIIITTNFIAMSGSLIYIMSWSPLFPFLGKLLNGGVTVSRSLMTAEVARSYPSKELQVKIVYLVGSKAVGFIVGPCLVLPFASVNIWFGGLHIAYGNFSGVILLALTVFSQFCVIYCAHDLSREYDMKASTTDRHEYVSGDNIKALKKACKSEVILFLLFMTFSTALISVASTRNFPVLVLNALSMPYETVSIGFTGMGVAALLLYVVGIKIKLGNFVIYWIGILSLISMIVLSIFQYVSVYVHLSATIKIAMLILYVVALSVLEIAHQLCLVVVFAKLISSKYQCYLEGIRIMLKQAGCLLGAFLCVFLLKFINIFMPISVVTNLISLFAFYWYRDYIFNPVILA